MNPDHDHLPATNVALSIKSLPVWLALFMATAGWAAEPKYNPGPGLQYSFVPQDYGMPLKNVADVAVDSKNNVYLIVRGDPPILVFSPEGKLINSWGKGLIAGPHGIYIDDHDNVFCVDNQDNVVLKFTTAGKLLMTLGTRGVV